MATSNPTRAAAVQLGVEVINGYVIIAERHIGTERARVILGARRALHGFDYVTAVTRPAEEVPVNWDWGHYFDMLDGGIAVDNFAAATTDYQER